MTSRQEREAPPDKNTGSRDASRDSHTAPNKELTEETLGGAVERVTFHSEESGFCVLKVKVRGQRELVTVTGRAATISPGEYIDCKGVWF
ncbi:MAG: hypothetical protein KC652_28030, partial [Cyanobacteria bacterium HKST-UBA01]|nr:hypothetical protein [Cyanobacteria bacterium HKST-UBA01]